MTAAAAGPDYRCTAQLALRGSGFCAHVSGDRVMAIAIFFLAHWQISIFFQTFFLHRYGAHRQFEMKQGLGEVLLSVHVPEPRLQLLVAARLRDPPPHAPRVQRHRQRPALALEPRERGIAHDRDQEAVRRLRVPPRGTRSALRGRAPRVARARASRAIVGRAHRVGGGLWPLLPSVCDARVASFCSSPSNG